VDQKTNSVLALAPRPQNLAAVGDELDWREEPDTRQQILFLWRVISKWRWLILSAVVAGILVGLVVTLLTTPIFRGTTTLQIERETPKIVNVEGLQPSALADSGEFFETQYGLLKSRSLAERVVRSLNLEKDRKFARKDSVGDQRTPIERATDRFIKNLKITPVRLSKLVDVSFESPNPTTAAQVANSLAQAFIQTNLERRYESSSYARTFLEARLAQVRQKLEDSERQLAAYATAQQIININNAGATKTDPTGGNTQSLTAADLDSMNKALADAEQARILAEQKWRQAQSARGLGLPELQQSPSIQALRTQEAGLEADYQNKLKVFKPEHSTMVQLRAQITEMDAQIAGESRSIKEALHAQYQTALNNENVLKGKVASLKVNFLDLQNRTIRYNIIQRDVDTSRSFYEGLLEREKEVAVAGVGTNNISIIDQAKIMHKPVKPKVLTNLAVAGGLGLVLGFALAFGLEQMDQSIRSSEDVETRLGIPMLGAVPIVKDNTTPFAAMSDPRSAIAEAYNSARTALQLSTADGVPSTLFITSPGPGEGKSTTAAALAKSLAALGHHVLLVDADLRNPSLHRTFERPNHSGLSNLLAGLSSLTSEIQATELKGLSLLPAGPSPPNAAELLAGRRLRTILAEVTAQFDHIVIDGPPIMGLADAPLLASLAGGTILVIESGETGGKMAKTALKRIDRGGAHILGALLTKFDFGSTFGGDYAYSYGYGYKYGYGHGHGYGYGGGDGGDPPGRLRIIGEKIGTLFRRS